MSNFTVIFKYFKGLRIGIVEANIKLSTHHLVLSTFKKVLGKKKPSEIQ